MPDDPKWDAVQRFDFSGEVTGHQQTGIGGIVARARLTRTGVLEYRQTDGSMRRELRHPDEVFDADSLDSLANLPVTDDHPGKVTPDNWRKESIGHVAGRPKREGTFVGGEIHIQHGPAIEKVKSGRLQEISCAYDCLLDPTPGVHDGQPYDAIQRRVRYNHVAAGPAGWGRAGSEVRMRLDAAGAVSGGEPLPPYVRGMTDAEKAALETAEKTAKQAGIDLEKARTDAKDLKTEADKLTAQARIDAAELVKVRTENAVLVLQAKRQTEDSASSEAKAAREQEIAMAVQLRTDAVDIFRDDKSWKPDGKTNEAIQREAIAKMQPGLKLDALLAPLASDPKAVSLVLDSTYRMAKEFFDKVRGADGQLRRALNTDAAAGADDDDDSDAEGARAKMDKDKRDAWKKNKKDKKGAGK